MPNDDNLINIVGKPPPKLAKKKRNRTRNRQAYMRIENRLQQQAVNSKNSAIIPVPTVGTAGASQSPSAVASVKTQAPTPQNIPGGGPTVNTKSQPASTAVPSGSQSQKPAANIAKSANKKKQEPSWLTPEKLLQWQQFQENLNWNFEDQPQNPNKQSVSFSINSKGKSKNTNTNIKTPANVKAQVNASNTQKKDTKAEEKMAEIKWELNKVDDLDDSTEDSPSKPQTQIIQGLASEIRLTVKDQRKLITIKESSSRNDTVAKPVEVKHQESYGARRHDFYNWTENRQPAPSPMPRSMPAGVPRTFLMNQNSLYGAIQPQENLNINIPVQGPASCAGAGAAAAAEQQYSPTEIYDPTNADSADATGGESPELEGQKRLSAFHRLGPVAQSKKPKLTINLLCNKDVREVVDDTKKEDENTPVHLRQAVLQSTDEVVMKYLPWWPWKKNVPIKKTISAGSSKSATLLEQMEEAYDKDSVYFQVSVSDYPPDWRAHQVLDLLLASVRGRSFIPCFIEFTPKVCKFLVIRSKPALTAIHRLGFYVRQDDCEIGITISQTELSLNQLDFMPRLVLRKLLSKRYDSESKLDLEAFTLQEDISNFIYFPLSRSANQAELTQLQSTVAWEYLTELNLSHNRLTSLDALGLEARCPRLRRLDAAHNQLARAALLLRVRALPLRALRLEGNPLCAAFTDPARYLRALRLMFPALAEIDGVPIQLKGDLPKSRRHYCPEDAKALVERFLEVFFPLLDSEDRGLVEEMYGQKAVMTITYRESARPYLYRYFRNLTIRARSLVAGELEAVRGAAAVGRLLARWPPLLHDPTSFTSDVLLHTELSTILRVSGIVKLTSDSLAQDEHLLAFTRTFVLTSRTGVEYKIQNEMVHWDVPSSECANVAFQVNTAQPKPLTLKFESPPDKATKEELVNIFSKITDLDKENSERCLELKEWNMKTALEHFMKLVKLDCLESLMKTDTNRE